MVDGGGWQGHGAWMHVSFFGPNARPFMPFANKHVRHSQMAVIHFVYAASLILQPLLEFPRCQPTCLSFAPPCLFAVSFRVRPAAQQTKDGRVFAVFRFKLISKV